jgi:4-hydroxybenzoate polyprenyltransferase
VARFAAGLAGFCLLNSAVYAFNDIFDAEADRRNPSKRNRPVASGSVSVRAAGALSGLLLVAGLLVCGRFGGGATLLLSGIYLGVNVAYTLGAKHVPLVDVFLLASGFLIRILIGCALVSATPSSWLLSCSTALALFLSFAKRRAELIAIEGVEHRPALAGYTLQFLDQAMAICAGITLLSYAIYSQEAAVFVAGRELVGMPFVAFAILNYLRLAYTEGAGQSPVDVTLHSAALQLCAIGWAIATTWSLGWI